MAKYINQQDLLEKVREQQNNIFGVPCIIAEIENVETVEVVRCGKCKYWYPDESPVLGAGECHKCEADDSLWGENDFCSYGERR